MLIIRETTITIRSEVVRRCKECGNEFVPKKNNQLFCKKSCYKRLWDRERIGGKRKEKNKRSRPGYVCFNCGTITQLDFDPRNNIEKWREFRCPHCLIEKFID